MQTTDTPTAGELRAEPANAADAPDVIDDRGEGRSKNVQTTDTPTAGELRIEPGNAADAPEVAALGARAFYEAFTHVTQPSDMQAFLAETYAPSRLAEEMADPARVFLLAHVGDALAGFAQMRQGRADAAVRGPAPVELQRLYVDARWHGAGVAQALTREALAWAAGAGYKTLWLGVWERNARAMRFYRKLGMEVCGSHIFRVGSDPQVDLLMEGPIGHRV